MTYFHLSDPAGEQLVNELAALYVLTSPGSEMEAALTDRIFHAYYSMAEEEDDHSLS